MSRTIIAGSRDGVTFQDLEFAISKITWKPSVIISGGARGADTFGIMWAVLNHIPFEKYIPDWRPNGTYDRSAGFKRNIEMAENADSLIALWNGSSRGTKHMIGIAKRKGFNIYIHNILTQS